MGTNYYLRGKGCPVCKHGETTHIGKSSAGWVFSLRVYPDDEWDEKPNGLPKSLTDWVNIFNSPAYVVVDEYGKTVTSEAMIATITERSHPRGELRRHPVDGDHCVAQGDGTYDLIAGEFS